jgi:hypothetical protein
MRYAIATALLSLALLAGAMQAAPAGDVTKPYYYLGTGRNLSAVDQQNLAIYRDQLEAQQRAQQLQLYQGGTIAIPGPNPSGPLRPLVNPAIGSSNLYQTQSELGRVNGLLNTSRTMQMLTPPAGLKPLVP